MRYPKKSIDYQINMDTFHEMDECVPMTKPERDALRHWVRKGFDLETNPWNYLDGDSIPLNYLQAYRLEFGYSAVPGTTGKVPTPRLIGTICGTAFFPKMKFTK